ncbi:MAG: four helix bundle protein [Bacteroidaceae bacterium]|nr:four helix bundle protein [Bacteroidaceae bacterium]MBQ9170636.1 four helix bundle protein [Bacteroidaceae bacterium]MBQ9294563.1 four helix bundle protein [Bacteroidaceae bacterium]
MKESIVRDKSMSFAIRIVRCYKYLVEEKHEFILSKQMLRSGTSVGANIKEALRGQSRPDFTAKMNISLKEASECEYWIELLTNTDYLPQDSAQSLLEDCRELIKILTSIVKSMSGK